MGTSGWDMPIQNIKLIAIAPMNMLQAEIYEYVLHCSEQLDLQVL